METNSTQAHHATRIGLRSLLRPGALSIRFHLIACFILIVLLMIAADGVALWQYWQIEAAAQRVGQIDQISFAVVRIHLDVYSFRDRMAALAGSQDSREFFTEAATIQRSFLDRVDHTEQMLRAAPDIDQDAHISYALESLRVTLLSQLDTEVQLATAGEWSAVQLRAAIEIPALIEFSSALVERVDQQALEKQHAASDDAQKARQRLFIIVPIAASLTLLAAAALGWYVTRTVSGPLSALTASAEALARGDFHHRVQLSGNNELAVLGNAFNYAAMQLQSLYEDLRQSERELLDVIETIPTFAWTALPDGSVDFVNRQWREYTGFSREKTSGSGWQEAVHALDLERHMEKWHASLATGTLLETEARFRRAADAQYRWFLVRAVPLLDKDGQIVKWFGTLTDIEDRKRAEHEREQLRTDLAHVNRVSTMGELVASISHELKQPITAAIVRANTVLQWLSRDPPNLSRANQTASEIIEDGTRASEIIDRLRSLYKKSAPKREPVAVNDVIDEMVGILRPEATRHAVSIRADLAGNLPNVIADRVQIQQVLMNLMLNGIEAMQDTGGVLMLKSKLREDGPIQISLNDTGPGLSQGKTDQIFDAFFTTKPQGSGMGLAISKSIVESHGGRIWANGNGSRGATFHFTLPVGVEAMKEPARRRDMGDQEAIL
ncbi:MAG TPA: ATP-binding protein [Terracidiphilus sp.]|jgi:PAS domain S-box-containing protein